MSDKRNPYGERLYPYAEQLPDLKGTAKLTTRDGRVIRSFFGTYGQAKALAGEWMKKYYDEDRS